MVLRTLLITCPDCQSESVIRHGRTQTGYQRYLCKRCQGTFSDAPERGHTPQFKEHVLATYQERASMRGIQRVFKISRNTLTKWLRSCVVRLRGLVEWLHA